MEVCGHEQYDNGDDTKDHYAILNLLILLLQTIFSQSESIHITSDHFQGVFNLLCLKLNASQMFLGHDVGIVGRLDSCLQLEIVHEIRLGIHILDAHLEVSTVKGSEVMSQLGIVPERLDFLATGVSDCQDEISARAVDLYEGYNRNQNKRDK